MNWPYLLALAVMAVVLAKQWWRLSLLTDAVGHLASSLHYESIRTTALTSLEAHRLHAGILEQEKFMSDAILRCRGAGRLDTANKLSELQRWADVDYESHWLDGMFRGFP